MELKCGKYTITVIDTNPPSNSLFIQDESGEGMSVDIDELWKVFNQLLRL